MTSIFISYSRKDEAAVQQLVRILERMKHTIHYDKDHAGGHIWWDAILQDIRSSKIVILALSAPYLDSLPCALEYQYAEATGRLILPVMVSPVDFGRLPASISKVNIVTFTDPMNRDQVLDLSAALTDLSSQPTPELPNPLPQAPLAPIPRVSILLDAITGQQEELSAADQASMTDELIGLYLKPESRENARFALEKLRHRPELRQQYSSRIDDLLAMSSGQIRAVRGKDKTPPPRQGGRNWIGFASVLIAVVAIAIVVLLNKFGPSATSGGSTATETAQVTAVAALNTPTSSPLVIMSPPPPIQTSAPRPTDTPYNLGDLLAETKAFWATQTANAIASFTATPTATFTNTVDVPATLAALFTVTSDRATAHTGLTQTANANNVASTATVNAGLTQTATAKVASTATANATASFTATPTLIPAGVAVSPTIYATKTVQGVSLVWVPAGCFLMGSTAQQIQDASKQGGSFQDEAPQHQVCITQGYWIGQFDITNAQYDAFVQAGGYSHNAYWSSDGLTWKQQNNITGPDTSCTPYSIAPDQPRVCVNYYEAEAYAKWLGGRLPTEAEWECAARGPNSLIYPWGNTFDSTKANTSENGLVAYSYRK